MKLSGLIILATLLTVIASGKAQTMHLYIGTYTGPHRKGIYRLALDSNTGMLSTPELAGETRNPSFLALHPTRPILFAASEIGDFEGQKSGAVAAFAIDPQTRNLRLLN
ncbi:MAG TPA: beta-propeller fold lactonase family protein, partial [Tepidisphaeraceae bacterium]|nr:beta-propeller fold lactonase family protein [Tepidisphaeraceae bacterium]